MVKKNIGLFLVLLVTLTIYLPSLFYHFVGDDYIALSKIVTSPRLAGVFELRWPGPLGGYFRPLQWLPFLLGYTLAGLPVPPDPRWLTGYFLMPYHLLNIIFHLSNVTLVYLIAYFALKSRIYAALSAFIFAVHPINAEVVCWIAAFGDAAFTFFSLLSIILFSASYINNRKVSSLLSRRHKTAPPLAGQMETGRDSAPKVTPGFSPGWAPYYCGSLASFALALGSKESAACLPFLIILTILFLRHNGYAKEGKARGIISLFGYFFILLLYFVMHRLFLPITGLSLFGSLNSVIYRILKLAYYLKDLAFPLDAELLKSFLYQHSLLLPFIASSLILAGFFLCIFILKFKKYPLLFFSLFWVAVTLILPVIAPFSPMRRHDYFPLVGFSIFLTCIVYLVKKKYISVVLISCFILLELGTSLERNRLFCFSGQVVQEILFEIKKELPIIEPNSVICLVGIPGVVRNTPGFFAAPEWKMGFIYRNNNIKTICLSVLTFTESEIRESQVKFLDDLTFIQEMQTGLETFIRVTQENPQSRTGQWVQVNEDYRFKIMARDKFGNVEKAMFRLNPESLKARKVYFIGFKDGKAKVLKYFQG
jgi:hypothetical protein